MCHFMLVYIGPYGHAVSKHHLYSITTVALSRHIAEAVVGADEWQVSADQVAAVAILRRSSMARHHPSADLIEISNANRRPHGIPLHSVGEYRGHEDQQRVQHASLLHLSPTTTTGCAAPRCKTKPVINAWL